MIPARNPPSLFQFLLLASAAVLACAGPAVAEAAAPSAEIASDLHYSRVLATISNPDISSLEERNGPVGNEAQVGWFVRIFTNLWKKIARTGLVKWISPSLHLKHAKEPKVVANHFFKKLQVDAVTEHLFESEPFTQWSRLIEQAFRHDPKKGATIMFEVLVEHNEGMLFKSIAEARTTTGLTATVKGIESALLDKCITDLGTDKKLIDLYKNHLVQRWYDATKESAIVQIQVKVDKDSALRTQIVSTVAEAETSAIRADASAVKVVGIAKDVQVISNAEKELQVKADASDTEIVTSEHLKKWIELLSENKWKPMEVLTARLKASSHKEVLALCRSKETPEYIRTRLESAVFAKLKGQEGDRVLMLLDLEEVHGNPLKTDEMLQWASFMEIENKENAHTAMVQSLRIVFGNQLSKYIADAVKGSDSTSQALARRLAEAAEKLDKSDHLKSAPKSGGSPDVAASPGASTRGATVDPTVESRTPPVPPPVITKE